MLEKELFKKSSVPLRAVMHLSTTSHNTKICRLDFCVNYASAAPAVIPRVINWHFHVKHCMHISDSVIFFCCVCACRKINTNYTWVGIITVIVIVRHKYLSPQNFIAVTFNIGIPCSTQKASTNVCWMWNVTSWLGTEAGRMQTITHSGLLEEPRTIHLSINIWKNQQYTYKGTTMRQYICFS